MRTLWIALLSVSSIGCRYELPSVDLPVRTDGPSAKQRSWVTALPPQNPGRLFGPKLIYREAANSVLLYGGNDPAKVPVAEAWTYDGEDWHKLCGPCPPGPRVGHGFVLDRKRGVAVLFGGNDGTAPSNDIWELEAGVWSAASPAGTPPSPRSGAYVAYDPVRARTVVFGGIDGGGKRLNDVYEYDGASWHGPFKPATRPSPRQSSGSSATFVGAGGLAPAMREQVVIFGGEVATKTTVDDCWAWDGAGWTRICTTCTGTARVGVALGHDPSTGRLVVVNGWTGTAGIAGTIEAAGLSWSQTTTLPSMRDNSGLVFDVARDRFVLYGGNGKPCAGNCDETLEYAFPR
jgi:hypothetical protein